MSIATAITIPCLHRVLDGFALSEISGNQEKKWQKIGIVGEWKGHSMGDFSLSPSVFTEIIENFKRRGTDIVVDYDHSSLMAGQVEAVASGWISDLRAGQDGALYALINWTPRAEGLIKNQEYRYLSPTFQWETKDRVSGKMSGASLHSVALTNRPFLQELPAISLMDKISNNINTLEGRKMKEILVALGLADGEEGKILPAIESLKKDVAQLAEIVKEIGVTDAKTACSEVIRLKNPAVTEEKIRALTDELNQLKQEKVQKCAEEAVDCALKEGKLTAKGTPQHAWAMGYALKDPDGFKTWAMSATKIVPTNQVVAPARIANSYDDLTLAMAKKMNLTQDDLEKYKER